jgi:copper transport protein
VRTARAALAVAAGGLLLVVLGASPAAAHASLVSVDPADGARLDESPATVTLTFSETVSTGLGGVQVIDADGDQVQSGAARAEGAEVQVDVEPDLPDGTYVISYRVISADGHPVRGGSVFGVGDVDVDTGALGRVTAGGSDRTWEVVGAWGRGFAYAGTLVAAGGTAFLVLVHRGGAERAALRRVVQVAAGVGGLGVLAALPVQAALGTGQGPGALFDEGVLGEVSRDGVGLGVVLALVGLVVAVVFLDRLPWLALGGAAVAAGSFATNGHTRGGTNVALATTADVVHLLVAAAWAGGLVLLLTALRQRRRTATEPDDTVKLVGRFSSLATVTVVAVGISGGFLAWNEVRTWDGLTSSTYGRLVLAKVAVVAVVAALGAYNHFRLVPALRAGGKARAALSRLWTTLAWEVLLLVAVVGVTSVLVVVTPARTLAEAGVVERDVDLSDAGSVQLTVDPAQVGENTIHLYLFDPDGRPADIAETVTLGLSLPSADLGPITREATRAGPAHFQLDTADLAVAGDWTIEVHARVDRFTEATGTTEIPVAR